MNDIPAQQRDTSALAVCCQRLLLQQVCIKESVWPPAKSPQEAGAKSLLDDVLEILPTAMRSR